MNYARKLPLPDSGREGAEVLEHLAQLDCDVYRESVSERRAADKGGEVLALDILHLDEQVLVIFAMVVYDDHPPVHTAQALLQLRSQTFGVDHLLVLGIGSLINHFQRDLGLRFRIARQVDFAHRAAPEQADDLVAAPVVTGVHGRSPGARRFETSAVYRAFPKR